MCQLHPVPFHGDTIFCITHENEPYTAMKPIVENMGLAWQSQLAKLNANKERWSITMFVIESQAGPRETVCMPVRKLPAYLAGINPKKVRPELRAKIELYQAESDNALWDYWTKGRAERKTEAPALADLPLTPDQQCTLRDIIRAKVEAIPEAERGKGLYPQLWSRFNNHFRIARYAQLPQSRLSEAIEYLMKMELERKPVELPHLTPCTQLVPIDTKQDYKAAVVDKCLRQALDSLDSAFVHCQFTNAASAPKLSADRSLYVAAMCNIDAAAAILRAMISARTAKTA